MKTYAIGDLHGRFDLLQLAIAACADHAGSEGGRLIILGDMVDRGPQSREIIECLMAGPTLPNWTWAVIQGNHEQIMMMGLMQPESYMSWWVRNGGGATLASYGYKTGDALHPLKVPEYHLKWLAGLPVYVEDEHRIYVHAGVPSEKDPADTNPQTLQWMIWGKPDGTGATPGILLDEPNVTGKHIVHGHEQDENHPLLKPHRTNLDTGAFYSNRIVVGVFEDETPGGPVDFITVEHCTE